MRYIFLYELFRSIPFGFERLNSIADVVPFPYAKVFYFSWSFDSLIDNWLVVYSFDLSYAARIGLTATGLFIPPVFKYDIAVEF